MHKTTNSYAVVTCEVKLFWNNFEIISVFYFTRNHGNYMWNKTLRSFQNYIRVLFHM